MLELRSSEDKYTSIGIMANTHNTFGPSQWGLKIIQTYRRAINLDGMSIKLMNATFDVCALERRDEA